MTTDKYHQLQMLEALEANPEITQADLAAQVGVAVGTVNWYLKRWSSKGLVKIQRMSRWRWHYILTPKGLAEKTRLAGKYLEFSMVIYRRTRDRSRAILKEVRQAGFTQVVVDAGGELADIFDLTCLEMGVQRLPKDSELAVPIVTLSDSLFMLHMPDESET